MHQQPLAPSEATSQCTYTTRTSMHKALEILNYENRKNYPSNYNDSNNNDTKNKHDGKGNGEKRQDSMDEEESKSRKILSFSIQ